VSRFAPTLLFPLTVAVGASVASAQPPDLVTDRPDQTESATAVARGLVQVEMGYRFARGGEADDHQAPGTLVRVGLGGRTELRIGHAGVVGGKDNFGAGDSALGAKVNLIERADGWQPELALMGGLSLPTGAEGFSSDGVDPSFLLSLAYELSPRLSFGSNIGAAWESSPGQPDQEVFVIYSLVLGVGLTERLSGFLELFGNRSTMGVNDPDVSVDGGLTFLLTNVIQLDAYAGRGLWGRADDLFIGSGLSFRLPR